MNNAISRIMLLLVCLSMASCSTSKKIPSEAETGDTIIIAPEIATSKPVLSLIIKARKASRQGNISQARADIERAIRIEPRNATLWHYLGKLSLQQERYKDAINYGLKSNQLSTDKKLKSDNWRILAHGRYQLGDLKGAQSAQDKSRKLLE